MGRDCYLPQWFGAAHPKYRTPYRSIVFLVPVALVFASPVLSCRALEEIDEALGLNTLEHLRVMAMALR